MASTDGLITRLLKYSSVTLTPSIEIDVVAAPLAVDVRQRPGLSERRAARPARRNRDAVGQLGQLHELPAVERQVLHLAVVDDLGDFGVRRPEQRRLGRHRDRVGQLTELENDRQLDLLPDIQRQPVLLEALEAGELDEQLEVAHGQRRQHEATIAIRQPFGPAPAGHVKGDHARTGKHAALCVLDHAGHFGRCCTVRGQ